MTAYKVFETLSNISEQLLAEPSFNVGLANAYCSRVVIATDHSDLASLHSVITTKIKTLPFVHQFGVELARLEGEFTDFVIEMQQKPEVSTLTQTVTTPFTQIVACHDDTPSINLGLKRLKFEPSKIDIGLYLDMCSDARLTERREIVPDKKASELVENLMSQYRDFFYRLRIPDMMAPSLRRFIISTAANLEELATLMGMAVALYDDLEFDTNLSILAFKKAYSIDGGVALSKEHAKYGYVLNHILRAATWKDLGLNVMYELGKSKLGNRTTEPFEYYSLVYTKLVINKRNLKRLEKMKTFQLELLLGAPIEKHSEIRGKLVELKLLPRAKAVDPNGVPVMRVDHFDMNSLPDTWGSRLLAFTIGLDTSREDNDILLN